MKNLLPAYQSKIWKKIDRSVKKGLTKKGNCVDCRSPGEKFYILDYESMKIEWRCAECHRKNISRTKSPKFGVNRNLGSLRRKLFVESLKTQTVSPWDELMREVRRGEYYRKMVNDKNRWRNGKCKFCKQQGKKVFLDYNDPSKIEWVCQDHWDRRPRRTQESDIRFLISMLQEIELKRKSV